ncbi:hypothetical protein GCM10009863_04110 [Streptomyces axinellae]|uniref:Uncharacterized protein n=1 Tax=Streptomyces axinellae TaxID=552788 RepID=A0ABP6BZU4_9ACTN
MIAWLVFGGIFLVVVVLIFWMTTRPANLNPRTYGRGGPSGKFTGQAWTAGESDGDGGVSCGGGSSASCGGGGGGGF